MRNGECGMGKAEGGGQAGFGSFAADVDGVAAGDADDVDSFARLEALGVIGDRLKLYDAVLHR